MGGGKYIMQETILKIFLLIFFVKNSKEKVSLANLHEAESHLSFGQVNLS